MGPVGRTLVNLRCCPTGCKICLEHDFDPIKKNVALSFKVKLMTLKTKEWKRMGVISITITFNKSFK